MADAKGTKGGVGGDWFPVLGAAVEALQSIARDLGAVRAYIEANGLPGSFYERAQRAIGRTRSCFGVVRIWRTSRDAVGPGEAAALRELCVGVAAGLALPTRDREDAAKWARWVIDGCLEREALTEDAAVTAHMAAPRPEVE